MDCDGQVTLLSSVYHPSAPKYTPTEILSYIEEEVNEIVNTYPSAQVILAGDVNQLSNTELIVRRGLTLIVHEPTRGENKT